jgi:hypothetical protein
VKAITADNGEIRSDKLRLYCLYKLIKTGGKKHGKDQTQKNGR